MALRPRYARIDAEAHQQLEQRRDFVCIRFGFDNQYFWENEADYNRLALECQDVKKSATWFQYRAHRSRRFRASSACREPWYADRKIATMTAPAPLLDGHAPSHEHYVGRGERVTAVITAGMFGIIGVALPVVYVVDKGRHLLVALAKQPWEAWAFIILPLVYAALCALLGRWFLRKLDLSVLVYPNAIVFRKGEVSKIIRFDDIIQVADGTYTNRYQGQGSRTYQNYLLKTATGVVFVDKEAGLGLRGAINFGALQEAFARAYGAHAGRRHLLALGSGASVSYGSITADIRGMHIDGRTTPWRGVTMSRTHGPNPTMTITAGEESLSLLLSEVPDYPALAFMTLLINTPRPAQQST